MEIPQDIRSKISQLDDLAREIAEWLTETDDDNQSDITEDLKDTLQTLEGNITDFQEEQGWI